MERRLLLAVVLCVLAIFITQKLFPTPATIPPIGAMSAADSAAALQAVRAESANAQSRSGTSPSATQLPAAGNAVAGSTTAGLPAKVDTLTVTTPNTIVAFSNVGAVPLSVVMRDYQVTVHNVEDRAHSPLVHLGRPGEPLLSYRVITPQDTIALDRVVFSGTSIDAAVGSPLVTYVADVPGRGGVTWHVTISYAFTPDGYLSDTRGWVSGSGVAAAAGPSYLLVSLPSGFSPVEADTTDDLSQLAYSYKPMRDDAASVSFRSLKPNEPQLRPGPITWIAAKDKYFVVGILSADTARAHQFAELNLAAVPNPRGGKVISTASAFAVLPLLPEGAGSRAATGGGSGNQLAFNFQLYMGPQEFRRLRAIGRGFENLNPYGGFLHPILQPFATVTLQLLLWMRQVLKVSYGWVLIIFGVVIRLLLWPLNQRAMESSMKMQRIQPHIAEVQAKHKGDHDRLQTEMMRVYAEHGMSPWSPILGCLPMLLPWPFFAALFFVFRNTIEFRGVPFLWLHDISVRDPYFILPILLVGSMFLSSWISMRNVPPNPQTKMMSYMMPAMMGIFFWNIAAGLNLYYLVQTIASVPQQWYVSNQRAKAAGTSASVSGGDAGGGSSGSGARVRPRPSGAGSPARVPTASGAQGSD
jgi:YidC/Oxa1 family membrane protein insertase